MIILKVSVEKITLSCLIFMFMSIMTYAQEYREYVSPKFSETWTHPSEQPDRIALNLAADPAHSISVTWRTDTTVKEGFGEIAIALGEPKFWRNAKTIQAKTELMDGINVDQAGIVARYHSVTFNDLIPDTLYAYRVGDGEHWSEWIQFRTASTKSNPFSFLYVGDAQNYILELWSRLIREGYRKDPDASFIIHAGDLINRAHNERDWHEWFTAGGWIHRMMPSLPTPGNHEYRGYHEGDERRLSLQWKPQFTLPENGPEGLEETVYYVDYQGARFIMLNSNTKQEEQAEWLEKILSENTQKWVIASFHHPLFSASAGRDNEKLRNLWKPVFDKYSVDLALQGHDHSYARGRTLPVVDENVVSGINLKDRTGPVYVVSVSGGKMYSLKPDAWDAYEANRDRGGENVQLIQQIEVDGDTLAYHSYTATGELYDAFYLVKKEGEPNIFIERQTEAIKPKTHDNTVPYRDLEVFNFEDGNLDQWKTENPLAFEIAKNPVRNGHYSVKVKQNGNNTEAIIQDDFDVHLGMSTWYGFSCYIPKDFDDKSKTTLAFWSGSPDDDEEALRPPVLSLNFFKGKFMLEAYYQDIKNGAGKSVQSAKLPSLDYSPEKGKWVDIVVRGKWSFTDKGELEMWVDGKKMLEYKGKIGFYDGDGPVFNLGILQKGNTGQNYVYFDEYRRGNSFDEVDPGKEVQTLLIPSQK